ncbi:MAG: aldo/keto reductase [Candidatus Eremiobacteraeota bacterium]|nr:aldo/keto reductase [Candidatus Eremiobacteraeota bacterium]
MSTSQTSLPSDGRPAAASGTFVIGGDLPVHRLGFGAMRITGNGVWGEPKDRDEAIAVLRLAVELGVTIIDTADSYGPEVSERLIAEALYPYPPNLVIATKAGLVRPGPSQWVPDGRPEHLREAVEGSLRRLRMERIDLLQLHRPDPKVPFADQIGAIVELQRQGKIRHIGLSNVSVAEIEAARRWTTIVSVQNLYNLTDRESEAVLEYCTGERLGFIPWFPLDTGDLLKSGGTLAQIAQRLQATPAEVALAWLLAKSPIMLPIPGTSNRKHLRENLGAALLRLSAEEMRELEACAQG